MTSRSVAKAVASTIPTLKRSDMTSAATGASVSKTMADHAAERTACGLPDRFDENFIKWIPLAIPMLAVMLAVGAYLILGMVL